ncbi:MAG: response regulator transcription factor [Rhodospirillales bacterium]|nr:response regulator transcription factor [Rhodospirillales bacterium]
MPVNAETPHILVVDDDNRLRSLLAKYLGENGFAVSTARDAADARGKIASIAFDLIVLDVMMPGENGMDFAQALRRSGSVPILMLTAMSETEHRIAGLERGVDDYLSKPFEPRELVLRIHSVLRRAPPKAPPDAEIRLGEVVFSPARGEITRNGKPVKVTEVEVTLLKALARKPGAVLSREELVRLTGTNGGSRAIDVHVTRLRRKIEADPKIPRYLQTVRGKGYVLRPD